VLATRPAGELMTPSRHRRSKPLQCTIARIPKGHYSVADVIYPVSNLWTLTVTPTTSNPVGLR
jgi:hypothetical protein